jgi:hypothetical protein
MALNGHSKKTFLRVTLFLGGLLAISVLIMRAGLARASGMVVGAALCVSK